MPGPVRAETFQVGLRIVDPSCTIQIVPQEPGYILVPAGCDSPPESPPGNNQGEEEEPDVDSKSRSPLLVIPSGNDIPENLLPVVPIPARAQPSYDIDHHQSHIDNPSLANDTVLIATVATTAVIAASVIALNLVVPQVVTGGVNAVTGFVRRLTRLIGRLFGL